MEIYFPFFAMPGSARAGYYYGTIIYDKENERLSLSLSGGGSFDAVYASFGSPASVDTEFLKTLIQKHKENAPQINAIVIEHYTIESRLSEGELIHVPIHNRIFYVPIHNHIFAIYEDVGINDGGKILLNYVRGTPITPLTDRTKKEKYHFFILSCNEYCAKGEKGAQSKKNLKVVKSILVNRGQANEVVTVEDSQSAELSEIMTRPLIARLPSRTIMIDVDDSVKYVKMDLLEALMGSTIFIKRKGKQRSQLPILFPTPLLSALFYKRLKEKIYEDKMRPADLLALPSASYIDVGGIAIKVNLENLYKDIFWYLIEKLNAARKLLYELFPRRVLNNINLPSYMEQPDSSIRKLDIYGEAIFKALANNLIFVRTRELIEGLSPDEVSKLKSEVSLPHRIRRIDVSVPVEGMALRQLSIDVSNEVYIAYETVRNREGYLRALLERFGKLKKSAPKNSDLVQLLLASFVMFLDEKVGESCRDRKRENPTKPIAVLKPERLAHRMTLILLELGLHTISHLLLKYILGLTKLHRKRLKELVVLCIDKNYVKNKGKVADYYLNIIINGFTYRLTSETGVNAGLAMISDGRPYSHDMWKSVLKNFDSRDFVDFSLKLLGKDVSSDECLRLWRNEAKRLETRMKLYDDVTITLTKQFLNDLFGLGDYENGNLALPLLDVRPLLQRDVVPRIAKKMNKSESEVRQILRPHMEAFYTTSIPFCFDGCYNCIVLDKGCNSNPLSKEWSISKSIARFILQELRGTG